jgi:hypothetical protein
MKGIAQSLQSIEVTKKYRSLLFSLLFPPYWTKNDEKIWKSRRNQTNFLIFGENKSNEDSNKEMKSIERIAILFYRIAVTAKLTPNPQKVTSPILLQSSKSIKVMHSVSIMYTWIQSKISKLDSPKSSQNFFLSPTFLIQTNSNSYHQLLLAMYAFSINYTWIQ